MVSYIYSQELKKLISVPDHSPQIFSKNLEMYLKIANVYLHLAWGSAPFDMNRTHVHAYSESEVYNYESIKKVY